MKTKLSILLCLLLAHAARAQVPAGVPNFASAGYRGGMALPDVGVEVSVQPGESIQDAIETVSRQPLKKHGYRGAVLLEAGTHVVEEPIRIDHDGVVLSGDDATIVHQTTKQVPTVQVGQYRGYKRTTLGQVLDKYVPVGNRRLAVDCRLKAGDVVWIVWRASDAWVKALGLSDVWDAKDFYIEWEREIVSVYGRIVMLDSPLTSILDARYGTATVERMDHDHRIHRVGISGIRFVSEFDQDVTDDAERYNDEDHANLAIRFMAAKDCWVRDCTGHFYGGSFVQVNRQCRRVTVQDCAHFDGVSRDVWGGPGGKQTGGSHAGGMEYAFSCGGADVLFRRCFDRYARHGFICNGTGAHNVVFLDCYAHNSRLALEPHSRFSTGILFDRCYSDTPINLHGNKSTHGQKTANSVAWNCTIRNRRGFEPALGLNSPGGGIGTNWAVGCDVEGKVDKRFGGLGSDATVELGKPTASSLYLHQRGERNSATPDWEKQIESWKRTPYFELKGN